MDGYEIKEYENSSVRVIGVSYDGWEFLVVYGHLKNGWFVAIPNWKICAEIAPPSDVSYNTEKIYNASDDTLTVQQSRAISKAIYDHSKGEN